MQNQIRYLLINFFADINEQSVNQMINFITQNVFNLERSQGLDNVELVIQIASNGGQSDKGILAYNYLKQINLPITTINIGNVDSAAVMIFCAGLKRLVTPSSRFVLHSAMTNISGNFTYEKLQEIASLNKKITKQYIDVIKHTSGKDLQKKIRNGTVIDSQEAKNINLATDKINESYIKTTFGVNAFLVQNPVQNIAPIALQPNQIIQN